MKNFKSFLTESEKTYKFKIRVAGEMPEGFNEKLKTNLEKYEVVSIGSAVRTPIQEKPLDFPQLQNTEIHTFDVEVKYPVTSHILEKYIVDNCSISHSHVVVRGEFDPIEAQQQESKDEPYESILNTEDMGGESAQDSVAANRVMELLKELETARKEREIDPMEGAPAGESKDIDQSENSKSVVGN